MTRSRLRILTAVAASVAAISALAAAPPEGRVFRIPGPPARDLVYRIPPRERRPERTADARPAGQQTDWGHAAVRVADAWAVTRGRGARVAVLDTGVDATHRDLRGRVVGAADFTGGAGGPRDPVGHGTFCAGVVAAADDRFGVVGVAPDARLLDGRVLDAAGAGLSGWIADGVDWAAAEGADVISLSLGGPTGCPRLRAAVRRAVARGVIVVAAAGNGGPGRRTVEYPGAFPEVVCVGAADDRLAVADFSGRGPEVDAVAPGVAVRGTYPGDRVAAMSGTSMATPYVAGVAALYVAGRRAAGRTPTPAEFRRLLEASSVPRGRRPNPRAGWGLIQAGGFVGGGPALTPGEPDFTPDAWRRVREAHPGLKRVSSESDAK